MRSNLTVDGSARGTKSLALFVVVNLPDICTGDFLFRFYCDGGSSCHTFAEARGVCVFEIFIVSISIRLEP